MNEWLHPTKVRVAIAVATFLASVLLTVFLTVSYFAIVQWPRSVRETNEQVLRQDLVLIRGQIRRYALDKQALPQSFQDLVEHGYVGNLPDPVTGQVDWQAVIGEDSTLLKGKRGVIDVHSASVAISSKGTPYNTW